MSMVSIYPYMFNQLQLLKERIIIYYAWWSFKCFAYFQATYKNKISYYKFLCSWSKKMLQDFTIFSTVMLYSADINWLFFKYFMESKFMLRLISINWDFHNSPMQKNIIQRQIGALYIWSKKYDVKIRRANQRR